MSGIDHVHGLTKDLFVQEYLSRRRPVKMSGVMDEWPAMTKWDFSFFQSLKPDVDVDVEVGDCLTQATVLEKWKFSKYVAAIAADSPDGPQVGGSHYLTLFPLLETFPDLRSDVCFHLWPTRYHVLVAWIGPKGTFSGLHWDRSHSLLAQVRGSKRVMLYEPEQWARMYESRKFDWGTALSQVDALHPDYERFPLFKDVSGTEILLEAGQMLYLPLGWPHYVVSLEPSVSLSSFGYTHRDLMPWAARNYLFGYLHDLGLYRRSYCVCHGTKSNEREHS
jgi:Cupin-like domain